MAAGTCILSEARAINTASRRAYFSMLCAPFVRSAVTCARAAVQSAASSAISPFSVGMRSAASMRGAKPASMPNPAHSAISSALSPIATKMRGSPWRSGRSATPHGKFSIGKSPSARVAPCTQQRVSVVMSALRRMRRQQVERAEIVHWFIKGAAAETGAE